MLRRAGLPKVLDHLRIDLTSSIVLVARDIQVIHIDDICFSVSSDCRRLAQVRHLGNLQLTENGL